MLLRKAAIIMIGLCMAVGMTQAAIADEWTFMVYLDGDNNLEGAGIDDFAEMASVGSSATHINIVVQFDRISGFDTSNGNWTTCKRFYVTSGMVPTAANEVADLGEVNMADPATLTAFINWATAAYPADNYALILWNHGGGWRALYDDLKKALKTETTSEEKEALKQKLEELQKPGFKAVCWDDTSGGDSLTMSEVQSALNAATPDMDLIGFDACLMQMIEVAHEIKDTGASVMVGSEETEPFDGWPYNTLLTDLVATPALTPAQLGSAIVTRYYESYTNDHTQAAIDLGQMNTLSSTVSTLASTMISSWNTDTAAVKAAAQSVMDELDIAIITEQHGASLPGSHGLAIYFPETQAAFDPEYNGTIIDFPADTSWEEFLADFYSSMSGSWIESCRSQSQDYDSVEHIDLYDFCYQLTQYVVCESTYTSITVSYSFEDISATGTNLNLADDSYSRFSIPFTFTFYCDDYSTVCVGSNGTIYFEDNYLGLANTPIPDTNGYGVNTFIAPFWDDLNPSAGGAVYYEVRGTAPNRMLIVQWHQVSRFGTVGAGTFQAILYEGSNDILFQYQDVNFGDILFDNGNSATVGLQRDTSNGYQYSYNTASLSDGLALRFELPSDDPPPPPSGGGGGGGSGGGGCFISTAASGL